MTNSILWKLHWEILGMKNLVPSETIRFRGNFKTQVAADWQFLAVEPDFIV